MSKWIVVGEWGHRTPQGPIAIDGEFIRIVKRKAQTAIKSAERMYKLKLHPKDATYWHYRIITPDQRRFAVGPLKRMLAGPSAEKLDE